MNFSTLSGFSRTDVLTADFNGRTAATFDETGAPVDADGTPNNGGSVTMQVGSHLYRIDVSGATGKVAVTGS